MSIDRFHFNPFSAVSGGLPIGIARCLILFNGRIAGMGLLELRDRATRQIESTKPS